MDLSAFLLARIAEDEQRYAVSEDEIADALQPGPNPMWQGDDGYIVLLHARLLAECAAKRAIVELHDFDFFMPVGGESSWEEEVSCKADREEWPCRTLRLLAQPYADHPDYDQGWQTEAAA